MKSLLKKYQNFIILIILILIVFTYLMYKLLQPEGVPLPAVLSKSRLSVSQTSTQPIPPPISFSSLPLQRLEELKAKIADWPVYENKKYKINVKYPSTWSYFDESSFPQGLASKWEKYNATEIFRTIKIFTVHEGAGMSIFYSTDLSRAPTQESIMAIANDYKKRAPQANINYFSVNNFKGVIAALETNEGRWQRGLAYVVCNNHIYYADWVLDDELNDISVKYENQFIPFLAAFVAENQECLN